MKKVHIICQKCGSNEMEFKFDKPSKEDSGVSISCLCCGELTGVEEWNEFNKKKDKRIEEIATISAKTYPFLINFFEYDEDSMIKIHSSVVYDRITEWQLEEEGESGYRSIAYDEFLENEDFQDIYFIIER